MRIQEQDDRVYDEYKEGYHRFFCEFENHGHECGKPADFEYNDVSEFSDPTEFNPSTYQTFRCRKHRKLGIGKEYNERELPL